MPTIDISHADLCNLVGKKLSIEEIKDYVLYAKGEVETIDGDTIKVDIKDTNRPDLWSCEGIAREIKGRMVKPGLPFYKTKKSGVAVHVDKKVSKVRPLTVCAVVKDLNITEHALSQMIQLQEKVSGTFGRNRREVAIGVYDLHKIKPPIKYTTVKPDGVRFVPLEFKEKMTPKEILKQHPKGKEFGYLLEKATEYPIFIDSKKQVLSIPPIINSDYTGKVTEETRDVFIECSGFDFRFLMPALNTIVSALADRGGYIESVDVFYQEKKVITPDLKPKKITVDINHVNNVSGLNLNKKDILGLLRKALYEPKARGNKIELLYPAYRQDIMHPRDIVEDVIISYGYNRIEPLSIKLPTLGEADKMESFSKSMAEVMTSLGFQEILSYTLANKENLFAKMNLDEEKIVEISNPVSSNWNVFRNRLLPGMLEFLSQNKHREYPQKIFEIGDCVLLDEKQETKTRDIRKLAVAITDTATGYEDISSILDASLSAFGVKYKLEKTEHSSFINGRVAKIVANGKDIGIMGEVHPQVLNSWKIDKPVAIFEMNLEKIKTLS